MGKQSKHTLVVKKIKKEEGGEKKKKKKTRKQVRSKENLFAKIRVFNVTQGLCKGIH